MNTGLWVWPSEQRAQRKIIGKVAQHPHLVAALVAFAKSKDGLSNSALDDALGDNSEWMTLWVVRQLTSLGFIEFKVDLFGGPATYHLTDLGRRANSAISGQPLQSKPQQPPVTVPPPPAQPVATKAA